MSKRIDFKELVDIQSFEQFLIVLETMKKSMQDIIALGSKVVGGGVPNDAKGLKDYVATIKSVEQANISLQEVEKQEKKTKEELKVLNSQYQSSLREQKKTLEENIATRNKYKASIVSLKVDLKEDLELHRQGIITNKEYKARVAETDQQIAKYNIRIQGLNKSIKDETLATDSKTTAYKKLELQYAQASKKAQDAGAIFGVQSRQFKNAAKEANEYGDKLKAIDAGLGRFNRNVGNYGNSILGAAQKLGVLGHYTELAEKIETIYHTVLELSVSLFKKKTQATVEATVAEQANTVATEANTASETINTGATEAQVAAEKAKKIATEGDTIATEANTTAQEANKLARLGWIAVALAAAAAVTKFIFSFEGADDKLEQFTSAVKSYFKTMSIGIALGTAEYTKAMQQIEDEENKHILKIAELRAKAQQARTEAMETDVYQEKIDKLKEFQDLSDESFKIEIEHAKKIAEAEMMLATFYVAEGKKGAREQLKKAKEAAAQVEDLDREMNQRKMRTAKQILSAETSIKQDELKLQQDAAKQKIEMLKEDEKREVDLNQNAYNDALTAMKEQFRKLNDADGTSPKHQAEKAQLWQYYNDLKLKIQKKYNEKQIAEMQKLQDTIKSIEDKTTEFDNVLIKEEKEKKLIAAKETNKKELSETVKQRKELLKQYQELETLSPERQTEQKKKINEAIELLDKQRLASNTKYQSAIYDITKEYSDKVSDIYKNIADESLKQEEKILERKATLAKKATQKDSVIGGKKYLQDIQKEKDIAREIELKKEEQSLKKLEDTTNKILEDTTTTIEEKRAKILQAEQSYQNDLINLHNEYIDKINDLDKINEERKSKDEEKRRQDALNAIEDFEKAASEKKQRSLDNQIDASKRHQDLLKEMAARGNQDAKNNLANEEAREIQLQAKKEKALQKAKQLEAGLALLKDYSKNLDTYGNTTQALTKTITDGALLSALLKSFSFFEGTEDTGEGGGLDSKGGKLAILHPHERVMTAEQNKAVDGLTNWELVNAGLLYKKEMQNMNEDKWQTNEMILNKFDKLEQAIKEKPVYMGSEYHKDSHTIIEMIEKGNSLVRNHRTLSKLG